MKQTKGKQSKIKKNKTKKIRQDNLTRTRTRKITQNKKKTRPCNRQTVLFLDQSDPQLDQKKCAICTRQHNNTTERTTYCKAGQQKTRPTFQRFNTRVQHEV
jgi:hypothetical protein